jgi:cell division septum initiation protein DivIVA
MNEKEIIKKESMYDFYKEETLLLHEENEKLKKEIEELKKKLENKDGR